MMRAVVFLAITMLAACRDHEDPRVVEVRRAAEAAQTEARQARWAEVEAQESAHRVEKLSNELAALGGRLDAEIDALASAKTDNDRTASSDKLKKLRREKLQLTERLEAAKATAAAKAAAPPP